jgi:nucleoside-diphosphate-sugar epimerase
MNEESKISVFGSSGFIGSRFCELNSDTLRISRSSTSPESDNILYLISTVDNYNVFSDPHLDIQTNLVHLMKVLEDCKNRKNLVFNFVSSWFVYGKTNDLPAKEESFCNPTGFYSITKRTAEQLIISYCETFGIKYRILRLCNVYGSGDSKTSRKKNAMQHLVTEVVNDRDVNLYNGGQNIRDFMHVDDVCRAIKLSIEKSSHGETINIGSGIPQSILDVITYAKEKTNSKSVINFIDPPDFHKIVQIENMYLDTSKLRALGFQQEISIYQGIDMIIKNEKRL